MCCSAFRTWQEPQAEPLSCGFRIVLDSRGTRYDTEYVYKVVFPFRGPKTADERFAFEHNDVVTYMSWVRMKENISPVRVSSDALSGDLAYSPAIIEDSQNHELAPYIPSGDTATYQMSHPGYEGPSVLAKPVFYQEDNEGKLVPVQRIDVEGILLDDRAEHEDAGDTIVNSIGMELKYIKPGVFRMGSASDDEWYHANEFPQHFVVLARGFYMGVTEVTQAQWGKVMDSRPWSGWGVKQRDNYPAGGIRWEGAVEFCKKLSEREGRRYRLPTEAEWEYACRAGTKTAFSFGSAEAGFSDYIWGNEDDRSSGEFGPVAQKKPNPWGLFDMHGNVWEICNDGYEGDYYSHSPMQDPLGPSDTCWGYDANGRRVPCYVIRSGSLSYSLDSCRSAHRTFTRTYRTHGFRVVLDLGMSESQTSEKEMPLDNYVSNTYSIDDRCQVTLSELEKGGRGVYQIDINVAKPTAQYRHIREASAMMVSQAIVIPLEAKMYYNTSRDNQWVLVAEEGKEDHALLDGAFEFYKWFVPAVGSVEEMLEAMNRTFEWIDSKKPNIVKPESLFPYKSGEGMNYGYYIPIDMIMDELNLTGFSGVHIDGVRFEIPVEKLDKSEFFIKFSIGQFSPIPTAKNEYGVEILEKRTEPTITGQIRGTLIDFKHHDGILIDGRKDDVIVNSIGMKLKYIPPGEFCMGSPEDEEGRWSDETQHLVRLTKALYMGVTEVTQAHWVEIMRTRPWSPGSPVKAYGKGSVKDGDNYPAVIVSWNDAVEFCRKLSEREGRKYRLPTEAEWEYACRAGTKTRFSFGNDAKRLGDHAWFGGNAPGAHVVAQKKPNPWGLFDMHGNVWEWCSDRHSKYYYSRSPEIDPQRPSDSIGLSRVLRGGAWVLDKAE